MHLHLRLDDVGDEFIVESLIVDGRVAGRITLGIGEYQLIGAALGLGADQTKGQLKVTHDKIGHDKEGNFKMLERDEEKKRNMLRVATELMPKDGEGS